MSQKVKVWDVAVRFFHWSQVLLIAALWYTGEEGLMAQHQLLAYTLVALVVARLIWGVIGSESARFSRFAATPVAAIRYLRHPVAVAGHNPASFYMIVLLLLLISIQLVTGLATFDNSYLSDGPLVSILPGSWVEIASDIHSVNINILLAAIAVHIVAALWHSVRLHNVLAVMLTGKDTVKPQQKLQFRNSSVFFIVFAAVLAVLLWWQGLALLALL